MTRRHLPRDLAERLLGGPVVWIGPCAADRVRAPGRFIWMFLTSLKDRQELYANAAPSTCRCAPTFRELYRCPGLRRSRPFSRFFLNSLWVCFGDDGSLTTVVSVLAGYAIARLFVFAGRDALLLIFSRHPDVSERAADRPAADAMARARFLSIPTRR